MSSQAKTTLPAAPGTTRPRPVPHDPASNGALRLAMQRSEPKRLLLLLAMVAASLLLTSLRNFTGGGKMQGQTFLLRTCLSGIMAAYVGTMLLVVRRATARRMAIPVWIWALTIVWECSFPTAAIAIMQNSGQVSPLDALTGPASFIYAVMIALSILRMRPWLCLLGGTTAAVGFASLFYFAIEKSHLSLAIGDYSYYLSYPVDLFLAGAAAAMVASAVRQYFLSSLREAAAKQTLDRIHNELDLARSIQMGLLPTEPPVAPGFDIAGWSRPADQTGGDYYDWQTLPDGRVLISVADATGHGIGPAMVSAVCRAYARAAAEASDAGSLLGRLNKLLSADLPMGKFVTFAGVVLQTQGAGAGDVEILSAGHGPVLLLRAARDGKPSNWGGWDEGLDTHGPPFAVLSDFTFDPPTHLALQVGDFLVLPTDGAIEWLDASKEQFGIERLREVIRVHSDKTAKEIIQEIDAALRVFAPGTTQQDDVTVVIIKRIA